MTEYELRKCPKCKKDEAKMVETKLGFERYYQVICPCGRKTKKYCGESLAADEWNGGGTPQKK